MISSYYLFRTAFMLACRRRLRETTHAITMKVSDDDLQAPQVHVALGSNLMGMSQ
jgi:hypothetical protein